MKRLLLVLALLNSVLMAMDRPYATEFIEKQQKIKIKEAQEKENKEAQEKERTVKVDPLNQKLLKILQDLDPNRIVTAQDRQNIKSLLEQGADVNLIFDSYLGKQTPLQMAVAAGDLPLIQLLIEHGANIDAQNVNGWTPLMMASERSNVDAVRLLIEGFSLPRFLQQRSEALQQQLEQIKKLGESTYFSLLPPELKQVTFEYLKAVKAQANPNKKNNKGETALDIARKKLANVKQLKEMIANSTVKAYSGGKEPDQLIADYQEIIKILEQVTFDEPIAPISQPQQPQQQKSWWQLWRR